MQTLTCARVFFLFRPHYPQCNTIAYKCVIVVAPNVTYRGFWTLLSNSKPQIHLFSFSYLLIDTNHKMLLFSLQISSRIRCSFHSSVAPVIFLACRWCRWDLNCRFSSSHFGTELYLCVVADCNILLLRSIDKNDLATGHWHFQRKCDVWLEWSQKCLVGIEITWCPTSTHHGHFILCAVWHSELLLIITRCQK